MSEFNKYSDGCICLDERELILVAKFLNNTTEVFKFADKNNMNINETWNLVNGVYKIIKAAEIWREYGKTEVDETNG